MAYTISSTRKKYIIMKSFDIKGFAFQVGAIALGLMVYSLVSKHLMPKM